MSKYKDKDVLPVAFMLAGTGGCTECLRKAEQAASVRDWPGTAAALDDAAAWLTRAAIEIRRRSVRRESP